MRIGSLFSGAGGLDMAVEAVFGGEVVWHCENDKAASKVLAHRWPRVPNLHDITAVDWAAAEPVDVVCGGWPCQPFSMAGKRKGAEDDRALWPYVAGAVRILRPRIVVLENVSAVLGPEFQRVANDLAACGYDIAWTCLRAADIGAPHRRERLFCLATDTNVTRSQGRESAPRYDLPARRDSSNVTLLPTPEAKNSHASQDFARANRPGSGGDDLVTAIIKGYETQWGRYAVAIGRWEHLTRPAPYPTVPNTKGNPRLAPEFSEWMMGWPAGWVTDVVEYKAAHRIIGNGVVPQQAVAALRWLLNVCEVAA